MAITYVGANSGLIVTATSGADPSLPYPAGINAGDLLVVAMAVGPATEPTTLSGYTRRISGLSGTSQSPGAAIFTKTATGSESGSLTVSNPTAGTCCAILLVYRGVDTTNPIDTTATEASIGASTAYTVTGQTTTTTGVTFVGMTCSNSGAGTMSPPSNPAAWTEIDDDPTTPQMSVAHYVDWASSGASGNFNFVRSASVRGYAAVIALRPDAGSTPANVDAVVATATAAAAIVDVTAEANVDATTTAATAAAANPTVTAAATVAATTSSSTATCGTPTVTAAAAVAAVVATATAAAGTPTAGGSSAIPATTATATATAVAPAVTAAATVQATLATATGQATAPNVTGGGTGAVNPPAATATAAAAPPAVSAAATVVAVRGVATAAAAAPAIAAAANVYAATALATTLGRAPTITAAATITGTRATATGQARAPFVGTGGDYTPADNPVAVITTPPSSADTADNQAAATLATNTPTATIHANQARATLGDGQ